MTEYGRSAEEAAIADAVKQRGHQTIAEQQAHWRRVCPVHHLTDCSPLLNGCTQLTADRPKHKSPEWEDFSPGSSHLNGCKADLSSENPCDKACIHHLYSLTDDLIRAAAAGGLALQVSVPVTVAATIVYGPHSRACGIRCPGHGAGCNANCPTCAGRMTIPLPLPEGAILKPGARI